MPEDTCRFRPVALTVATFSPVANARFGRQALPRPMSDIDDQLRDAMRELDDSEGNERPAAPEVAADPVVAESSVARPSADEDDDPHRRRNLGLLLGLLALGGGALSLVHGSSSDSLKFGRSVDEVLATKTEDQGRTLTVEGRLVHGSLLKRDDPCEYRFQLRKKDGTSGELAVRYPACIVPDNFRDLENIDVDVTATGRMKDGAFVADSIATKCPTKYEMEQQKKLGVEMPHGAVESGAGVPGGVMAGEATDVEKPKSTMGFDD
jgi:cytochrome c-type biogenesis protein CcmE